MGRHARGLAIDVGDRKVWKGVDSLRLSPHSRRSVHGDGGTATGQSMRISWLTKTEALPAAGSHFTV
jgi:hypothetical protein